MNNEELDSQLSAMFDDELPEPECQLLARRLARDEALKARWGRYALVGACIRMGRDAESAPSANAAGASVRQSGAAGGEGRSRGHEARWSRMPLQGDVAGRVSRMIAEEPPLLAGGGAGRSAGRLEHPAIGRWWQPVAGGAAVAAGVAAAAILWLRAGSPDAPMIAQAPILTQTPILATAANHTVARVALPAGIVPAAMPAAAGSTAAEPRNDDRSAPDSFVVPPPGPPSSFAPPIELANFVVAHSEYSMPLMRRSALSAVVTDQPVTEEAEASSAASGAARSSSSASETGNDAGSLDAPHADPAR